jgi:hypothetical protein
MNKKIAIIGAGFAGLVLANQLKNFAEITIFEKSRGVGGRMASRTKDNFTFDFGCQFFLAKNPQFINFLQPFIDKKIVQSLEGNFVEIDNYQITYNRQWNRAKNHYVATPKMTNLCKEMAIDLKIISQTKVARLNKINNSWQVFDEQQNFLGDFDWVFLAIPPLQVADILPKDCSFFNDLAKFKMMGCYSLMLGLSQSLNLNFDFALIKNSIISWISSENSKPHENIAHGYTILARNSWADLHIDDDLELIKSQLIAEFEKIINQKLPEILHCDIHRWRYANIAKQENSSGYLFDKKHQIGACGDWLIHGRVEASYLSAIKLFEQFLLSNNI